MFTTGSKIQAFTISKLAAILLIAGSFSLMTSSSYGQSTGAQARIDLTEEMVNATNSFLSSLSQFQRNSASYEFNDEERLNWHFIPRDRKGVPFKSMDDTQRKSASELIQTFFSAEGYAKTENVRSLELVLAEIEVNGRFDRDPDLYFITVFGEPGLENDWALRYEGHHLAFNWTFVGGQGVSSSPQFFGSNPAEVRQGPRIGTRVLSTEEDLARSLVMSMDVIQARKAIINEEAPSDIFTAAKKEVGPLEYLGLSYYSMNTNQKAMLMSLIEELASSQPRAIADERLSVIRQSGLAGIKFLWIGSTARGEGHYFRVQGSGFLIEYDNTQNNNNHVHLVWRDYMGDFGRDLIRMHYDAVALEHGPGHRH
jgi:hypothetical protein